MPNWTLVHTHPTQGRTFKRPLDPLESCSYLARLQNGTSDMTYHSEIHLTNGAYAHLFSETNIVKAWLSTKRRFPLVGASLRGADGTPLQLQVPANLKVGNGTGFIFEPHFFVQEHDLTVLRAGEIVFGSVASVKEAQRQAARIAHSSQGLLSDDLPGQLHVLRETVSERSDSVLHLVTVLAHHLADGTSIRTFIRCFLDTLARGEGAEPAQLPLEERLAMAIPALDLDPHSLRSLSPATRRWRQAAGAVIFQLRMAKMQGGQTLPRRLARSVAPHSASQTKTVSTSLTDTQTPTVLANCRHYGIAFGNAYFALAQVAMTRVLYRRYLRGEISEEEWSYRKRQPYLSGAHPLNLRPYLDKTWFENGGGGEFKLSTSFFYHRQPFMAMGERLEKHEGVLSDGAPPLSDILSFNRFLYRARLLKKQATALFSHPLFLDIVHATHKMVLRYMRLSVLQSMARRAEPANGHEGHGNSDENKTETARWVSAHGGASMGNLDVIFPTEYPIPSTRPLSPYSSNPHPSKAGYHGIPRPFDSEADTTPKIVVKYGKEHPRVQPGELYLGTATERRQLTMYVHFDGNVFEEAVVSEWLSEVKEAALWYLGKSRREIQELESGSGKTGRLVEAKL